MSCVLLALLLGLNVQNSAAQISGEIINGLRLLTLTSGINNNFVIYRGDYIQPELKGVASFELAIPELKIQKKFPVEDGEKAYIKMKKPGIYSFTAGATAGTIQVVEYSAASYAELSAADADKILQNTDPLILDVRTAKEFQRGYIQGANLLPVQLLQQNINKLAPYKNQDILVYCATGNRSTVASRLLIEAGFLKIYNLRYGIVDWAKRGYPVDR